MTLNLIFPLICLFLLLVLAVIVLLLNNQRYRKTLESCSDLLQEIFKTLEEPSTVTRILSQESPEEELVRLQLLLQKRGQEVFFENRALKQVLGGIPDGLVAINDSQTVIFSNLEFCRLMGLSEESLEGKKLFEILRHHHALKAAEYFLSQGDEISSEIEFLVNAEKMLQLKMIRLNQESAVHVILVLSDITPLKKLEAMRRDFVANVSHELRTPLTSIQGFVETLLDGAGADQATRERFLGIMKNDAERLRRLIEDLLTLSRIENQTQDFEKQNLNVLAEIEEVLNLFSLRIQQKRLNFNKMVSRDLELNANRDQFRQVLVNLLDNAVKFTPEGGVISISAELSKKRQIQIRVKDSGTGIQPENREKIFQRFFREDKARSRETGGTGLGLAIVKHIMEVHRGEVVCEENSSGGSVFILTFPQMH